MGEKHIFDAHIDTNAYAHIYSPIYIYIYTIHIYIYMYALVYLSICISEQLATWQFDVRQSTLWRGNNTMSRQYNIPIDPQQPFLVL